MRRNDKSRNKTVPNKSEASTASNKAINITPLGESVKSAEIVETPIMSNRSVRDITIQSASKDSGIAESGIKHSPQQTSADGKSEPTNSEPTNSEEETAGDLKTEERSDSRI